MWAGKDLRYLTIGLERFLVVLMSKLFGENPILIRKKGGIF